MSTIQIAAGTTGLAGAVILIYIGIKFFQNSRKEKIPTKWEEVASLTELCIHPLKSGRRINLKQAECAFYGLKQTEEEQKMFQLRDRFLVVYGEKDNEFRTARTYPHMLLIDVSVHDENHVAINAPEMETLYVKIPNKHTNKESFVKQWRAEEIYSIDCGDEAALWVSRYILKKDSGFRLGYNDASHKRDITKSQKKLLDYYKKLSNKATGLFHDLTSLLMINQASVDDLNKRIGNGSTVTAYNFRPNLIVNGIGLQPYAEDTWDWVKIGDVVLRNVKECTRCMLTTIDPATTVRDRTREPLTTLKTYRVSKGPEAVPTMGIHFEVIKPGFFKVGDKVMVNVKD